MAHPYQRNKLPRHLQQTQERPKLPSFLHAEEPLHDDGRVHIYTDGSVYRKDGSGGWGAYFVCGEEERTLSGSTWNATIGAMEMRAVLEALRVLRHFDRPVIFYIDSQYVVQALTVWWPNWRRRGWLTTTGKPVKHLEMLTEILDRTRWGHAPVAFRWIKGHAGIAGNEAADYLAGTARKDLQMLQHLPEALDAMSENSMWTLIAKRHATGLKDIFSDSRGWACKKPIMLWTYYLACSYMYYERECSIVEDQEYDRLCKYLRSLGKEKVMQSGAWWVEHLWDDSALAAGTGFHLQHKMPISIQNIGEMLYVEIGSTVFPGVTDPAAYMDVPRPRTRRRSVAPTGGTDGGAGRNRTRDRPAPAVRRRTRTRA